MQIIDEIDTRAAALAAQAPLEDDAHAPQTEAQFHEATAFFKFITGGRARFTIRSRKTGTRYTFRVAVAKDNPRMFFVSTLVGPDNGGDYAYVGFFKTAPGSRPRCFETQDFRVLRAGRKGNPQDVRFRALDWLLTAIQADLFERMPFTVEVWHEGRCGRCGRALTVPESVESGFGPECIGKV